MSTSKTVKASIQIFQREKDPHPWLIISSPLIPIFKAKIDIQGLFGHHRFVDRIEFPDEADDAIIVFFNSDQLPGLLVEVVSEAVVRDLCPAKIGAFGELQIIPGETSYLDLELLPAMNDDFEHMRQERQTLS
jgi:hypothetical protein